MLLEQTPHLGASDKASCVPTLHAQGDGAGGTVDCSRSRVHADCPLPSQLQASGFTAAGKESRATHRLALKCSPPDVTYVGPPTIHQPKHVARTLLTPRDIRSGEENQDPGELSFRPPLCVRTHYGPGGRKRHCHTKTRAQVQR